MSNKQFSERLNRELDNIGVPPHFSERIDAFAKLMKVSKYKADALLNGIAKPTVELLNHLSHEFDVDGEWLIGKSEKRTKKRDN